MFKILLRSPGVVAMLIALGCASLARAAPNEFPRLSDNQVGSKSLEVHKVLHGEVQGLFALRRTRQVVAVAGSKLWKFSEHGVLLGALDVRGSSITSGVIFEPEHFVDWVFTNHAQPKPYAPMVDGGQLTQAEVTQALRQADVVEFGKTDTEAWAYLWRDGQAWKMDLTSHGHLIDPYCHRRTHSVEALRWNATCFSAPPSAPAVWEHMDSEPLYDNWHRQPPRVKVVGFESLRHYVEKGVKGEEGAIEATLPLTAKGPDPARTGRHWLGDAQVRLRVGSEVLQFTAFDRYDGVAYRHMENMNWWAPLGALPGANPWLSVHTRRHFDVASEAALLPLYENDIGLYVVRPRGTGTEPPVLQVDRIEIAEPAERSPPRPTQP